MEEIEKKEDKLEKKILVRIEKEERRRLGTAAFGCGVVLCASIVLMVLSYAAIVTEGSRSGFFSFLSLAVSDFSLVAANFGDFVFSMLESFPVFSVAFFLCGLFFAIWSIAQFMNEITLIQERHFDHGGTTS